MKSFKSIVKNVFKVGVILAYIALIIVLIMQALTPGSESSNISKDFGDKIDQVATDLSKPEAEVKPVVSVELVSVTISGNEHLDDNITIYLGQSGSISSKVLPSDASNPSLVYLSSDEGVIYVYPDGKITAKAVGEANVTVSSQENPELCDVIHITVLEIAAESMQIKNIPEELCVGDKHKLEVKFSPSNTSNKSVSWASSDKSVLTVSSSGTVTAKAEGSATITATSKANGEIVASVTITVHPKIEIPVIEPEAIILNADSQIGYIGGSVKINAKLSPADAEGKIVWYSSDESVATVSQSGKVTCHKAGEVVISAMYGDTIESTLTITVKEVLSKSIALEFKDIRSDENGYYIKQGESGKVIATLEEGATVQNITFASSDESIAKIGADGVIETLKGGEVTITVSTSYDGETTSVSFPLTIERITLKDTFENFYYFIRKSMGHFGAFLVLGILGSFTYYIAFSKKRYGVFIATAVTLAAGFAVAGITEILQLPYFTQGRYCSFDDVMLDFKGYCTSTLPIYAVIITVYFIRLLIEKHRANVSPILAEGEEIEKEKEETIQE